ncbi:MAG: ArsA family ATPase [Acidobacteria bacterium]|nr:ArsA family ATPase [Acidobacteriota bacterium]MBI3657098.1 ArsA family ATPase [Acidobacteriota bacterium]
MGVRILLYSGKGGVGKTSVAAATGYRAAALGYRTIVLSLDVAHSLADCFDHKRDLMDTNRGNPVRINDRLAIQEIDVQEEVERNWGEVYKYLSTLLNVTGLGEVVAEELAILPGMEEVCGLLYINKYVRENTYDVIILDCAPTGESLRFISMPCALEWYMRKVFTVERNLARVIRPVVKSVTTIPMPEDSYFAALQSLFKRLEGVDKLIGDPKITSARLVTNPEKMVVKETQRAFMYFCLYGLCVDSIIINRIIPEAVNDSYFKNWKRSQSHYVECIEDYFAPIPILKANLFVDEIVGTQRIAKLADLLFESGDPTTVLYSEPPYRYTKSGGDYKLQVTLPFIKKDDLEVHVAGDELILRIGNFKRHVPLPRALTNMNPSAAKIEKNILTLTFGDSKHAKKKVKI